MHITKTTSAMSQNIVRVKMTDSKKLDILTRHSRVVMRKYPNVYKSKTLEELYTDEFMYKGFLPNATYIKNKATARPSLMVVYPKITQKADVIREKYVGKTLFFKELGYKSFHFITSMSNKMNHGRMESFKNDKYLGTQIRLTQIEVERAMAKGQNKIPLVALPEALPFHTMMGFTPNKSCTQICDYKYVKDTMKYLKRFSSREIADEMVPIIHKEKGKYFFDANQTVANATLKGLKKIDSSGKRDFTKTFWADRVYMTLEGKNFELWKQRALSQPILKETKEIAKQLKQQV